MEKTEVMSMDRKRFAKYFAQKPPVVLYVVGGVLLAAGVLIVLIQGGVYNAMSYYIGHPRRRAGAADSRRHAGDRHPRRGGG